MEYVATTGRTVIAVTWPFAAVMLLMLLIGVVSVEALSAIRAYVAGHTVWAAAERDTAVYVANYVRNGGSYDIEPALSAMSICQGDGTARAELLKSRPDYGVAIRGFRAGHNHPDDVMRMIVLFRVMRFNGASSEVLRLWARADQEFAGYANIMASARAEWTRGAPVAADQQRWIDEARAIHGKLLQFDHLAGGSINAAGRRMCTLLLVFQYGSTVVLLGVGYIVSRRILQHHGAMAEALHASTRLAFAEQERAEVLLRSIGDAVISTDRHGTVQFLNAAAERLTGWSGAEACGQPLEQVLRLVQSGEAEPLPIRAAVAQVLSEGKVMRFTAHGAELIRRDGSTAPIGERAAPLKNHEGEVVGMVVVMRDVTPERRLSNQLRHQANHDALTGLPNRALFEQRLAFMLQDCRGSGRKYAVMFLDLDQFKIVNDTCGHAAGDELIRRVATCTQSQLRAGDLVARLGGDEFGLLLPDCPVEEALQLAERVRHAIGGLRFNWEGRTFIVHASIGVVQDEPNLSSITDVLCAADRACYVAKEAGRNRVRLYRADDREIDGRHGEMQWVARLNAALEQDRFVLYAQEIKAIGATRWLAGRRCFEVLLRLREESGRLILPRAFLPAAERFGLMPRIDCHVITRVFAEQGRRHRLGLPIHRCMINLSNSSIDNQDLADFIADLLREHALPSGAIGFELTETAAITHLATATSVIERLRSLGCPIALDDFGSGMASYGYLRELPVDMMKIDGAFVRDMTRDPVAFAMVESMHRVAQAIGIQTVAEGIEDESTLSALTLMKIDFAQGHAISIEDLLSDVLDRCGAQTDALDSSRAQATG